MQIKASQRLLSVQVVPQADAYSDRTGAADLTRFQRFLNRKTGNVRPIQVEKGLSLVVYESPTKQVYKVGILVQEQLIGLVSLSLDAVSMPLARGWVPSSYIKPKYRGKGLALMVYKWLLDAGHVLISTDTQSAFSNGLWKRLAQEYKLKAVKTDTPDKVLTGNKALARAGDPNYILSLSK